MKAAEALTDYDFLLQANVAVPLQPPTSCYNTSRLLKLAIASLYDNNAKCKFRLLLLLRMLHYNRFFCLCFSRCESRAALSSDAPLGRWPFRAMALSGDSTFVRHAASCSTYHPRTALGTVCDIHWSNASWGARSRIELEGR